MRFTLFKYFRNCLIQFITEKTANEFLFVETTAAIAINTHPNQPLITFLTF